MMDICCLDSRARNCAKYGEMLNCASRIMKCKCSLSLPSSDNCSCPNNLTRDFVFRQELFIACRIDFAPFWKFLSLQQPCYSYMFRTLASLQNGRSCHKSTRYLTGMLYSIAYDSLFHIDNRSVGGPCWFPCRPFRRDVCEPLLDTLSGSC
jgi:hypothetical protein